MYRLPSSRGEAYDDGMRIFLAGACDIIPLVHIGDGMDRSAVNTHPHRQIRLRAQCLAKLQRAFHRFLNRAGEDERYSIAGGKKDQLLRRLRLAINSVG